MNKKYLYRLRKKIKALTTGIVSADDFDWDLYPEHYRGELSDIAKIHTQVLSQGDYVFKENELKLNSEKLPLHPNHRLLYETVLQLSPLSIIEIGCGGGDHLWNINVLSPETKLYGRDLSNEQISLLKKRHPSLDAEIEQLDITLPSSVNMQKVDIAFTQAVIMHIKTGNAHLVALTNLFHYAKKQVLLIENPNSHNFKEDIEFLFSKHMLPWDNLYMYYRCSMELFGARILVFSSVPLKMYPKLVSYEDFVNKNIPA